MSTRRYEVIVIGGGHNGLVAAAYLARAGRSVLVVERRELVGGPCVTEEVWPGYRVSVAAYLCSLLQPQVIQDLELERFGFQVIGKDPASFSSYADGRYLMFWQDDRTTLAEIAKFSTKDAEAYPLYSAHLRELADVVWALQLRTPPVSGDLDEYLAACPEYRALSVANQRALVKVLTQSAANLLDEWFESPQLKATLSTDGAIGANGGPQSAGTAYILLHHVMGGVNGQRGLWGFVRGGMGAVSESIAASARAHGAEIRVNTPVAQVLIENGEARGVVLESGEEIRANWVLSNAHPQVTFLNLVDSRHLPPAYLQAIRNYRTEGTSFKMNLALNGYPRFRAIPETPGPHHRATMHICPSMDYVQSAWEDCRNGEPARHPLLEMTIPTEYDRTLAPAGRHIMGVFIQYAPYTLRNGNWEQQREIFADRAIDHIEEYVPNIRSLIEHRMVLSPLDLERRFHLPGGNIFHGEMSLDQMFFARPVKGWGQYSTPIRNLYLCGSGTHPGGGVMGASGHNCAQEVLRRG
jgi:phytoene dehydrogenase-like protein